MQKSHDAEEMIVNNETDIYLCRKSTVISNTFIFQ